jgi:hypothetical protein
MNVHLFIHSARERERKIDSERDACHPAHSDKYITCTCGSAYIYSAAAPGTCPGEQLHFFNSLPPLLLLAKLKL